MVFFNHCGPMGWSGRPVAELTGSDVVSILEFCRREGARQGWNDAASNRAGEHANGPFHQDLLGGFPAQEWSRSYREAFTQSGGVFFNTLKP